jgi:hypothetical protein
MQIGGKSIENLLLNMALDFFFQEDTIPCFFTWEWAI